MLVKNTEFKNIFSIPIKSADGEEMFLKQFENKILFIVNTTGQCGNSIQWPIIEEILKDYKKDNVEVIYTPTNDFCGSVTFNDYVYGLETGKYSEDYAFNTYGIKSNFTELVSSRNQVWQEKNKYYDHDLQTWTEEIALPDISMEQEPRHPLYQFLIPFPNVGLLCGNFHKFITNRKGQPVAIFHNGTLLDAFYNSWVRGLTHENFVDKAENEKINLRKIIEEVIKTDNCSDPNYKYDPYNNIYPEWVKIQFNV